MTTKRTRPAKAQDIRVGHIYYAPFDGEYKATSLKAQPVIQLVVQDKLIQRAVKGMVTSGERLYRSKAKAKRISFNA
ncbi:MAG: hypothetical protein GY833_22220 [Aestuariibacter sp.]|nr:hypothetical protein [Aestuariibacter sp.]